LPRAQAIILAQRMGKTLLRDVMELFHQALCLAFPHDDAIRFV